MARIAVVDNDECILCLMDELFKEWGWESLRFLDAHSALEALPREQPQLIILELALDHLHSGWHVLEVLKANPATKSIPVLVWSGSVDRLKKAKSMLVERRIPFIEKPFDIDHLYEAITTAMQERALRSGEG